MSTDKNDMSESTPELKTLQKLDFPIVGIGASAGGLAAFEAFFSAMPADSESGVAFVLVQHLSPDHKSLLVDLVKHYTRMDVYEVVDGMVVQPNCAYIIPPNHDMTFMNGSLQLLEPSAPRGLRLPIDSFFCSLAQDQHERGICIILSGTGSDGTLGLRAIKGQGGMAMAQLPESTKHDGMPRSAIDTGLVDYVLPPVEMPAQLIAYITHAFGKAPRIAASTKPMRDDAPKKICALLRDRTGHDFSQYKENTLHRRIERRMALHQISTPDQYIQFLQNNTAEIDALFRDLLIGVTQFFRDPEVFETLQKQVIPRLFDNKADDSTVRIWVCGCSTGEEAYSIAILLQEYLDNSEQTYHIQIFATDIDKLAIEQARAGVFPASIAADVSPERLTRFFKKDEVQGIYQIQKNTRDLLIFSEQNVIKDPPFSKLDLISCRNLLIYLSGTLQKKLIELFHYALNLNGILFLGTSETVGEFITLFTTLDSKGKLYQRRDDLVSIPHLTMGKLALPLTTDGASVRLLTQAKRTETVPNLRELTEQALLKHYVQTAVLVNRRGDILYIYGRTGRYLEPASGDAMMNILPMAREGLRRELTTTLHRVATHKESVRYDGLRVKTNGDFTAVNLIVQPLVIMDAVARRLFSDLYLVVLEEIPLPLEQGTPEEVASKAQLSSKKERRIAILEQELRAKEEYLQATLEEMQSSNEELTSSNEEIQSINEELQSTNEELETSKEELQSVNEELATVNTELQAKVVDLSRVNNDINNLLAGTGVATLFVDHQLHISRFTPTTTQLIKLIQADIGRPVGHIVSNLIGYTHLVEDIRAVLDTLEIREQEVQTMNGSWYLMRIRPYRTLENIIEGAVIIFVDITERKHLELMLRQQEEKLIAIFDQTVVAISQVDLSGRIHFVNDQQCTTLGYTREELLQRRLQDIIHPEDVPRHQKSFLALASGGPDFHIEIRYCCKDGSTLRVNNSVNGARDKAGSVQSIVVVSIDITQHKQPEKEAQSRRKTGHGKNNTDPNIGRDAS